MIYNTVHFKLKSIEGVSVRATTNTGQPYFRSEALDFPPDYTPECRAAKKLCHVCGTMGNNAMCCKKIVLTLEVLNFPPTIEP